MNLVKVRERDYLNFKFFNKKNVIQMKKSHSLKLP